MLQLPSPKFNFGSGPVRTNFNKKLDDCGGHRD